MHTTILHLSLMQGVGPATITRIYDACNGDLSSIYTWSATTLASRAALPREQAEKICMQLAMPELLEKELGKIQKAQVRWVTRYDAEYPLLLNVIYAPPPVLYWRGASLAELCNTTFTTLAIIGSRNANGYGRRVIESMVPPLVKAGFVTVSGGARGADGMVHEVTVQAGGRTVVVLGSGLNNPYPHMHIPLFQKIVAAGGIIMSSFPMDMQPLAQNFPSRNRIIAGLSKGCLVVQAAHKSGTRITAEFALQQGREVFVVPGAFDDPLSQGCHALAREGAMLVTSVQELCAELQIGASNAPVFAVNQLAEREDTSVYTDQSLPAQIIRICVIPMTVDELALHIQIDYDILQQQLWDLQWQGKIRQDFTGRWVC
jgi:DNA processing protein